MRQPPVRGSLAPPAHIQAVERQGLDREKTLAAWLHKQPRPLALFACNDICAQQILNTCREHGIKVPEEVAVMGVDNDDVLCNICDPPLTSIEPDTERLGYEAAALLDRMMRGKKPKLEMTQIPPLRVVERASTDVVAIGDPITVQAVDSIRDHVDEGISVKDVQADVGRSRTDLEQRFHRWLKTSVRGRDRTPPDGPGLLAAAADQSEPERNCPARRIQHHGPLMPAVSRPAWPDSEPVPELPQNQALMQHC